MALKRALDDAGLGTVGVTTNVAATRTCDPTSPEAAVREAALAYLKSRVDITAALGGKVMAGPVIFPYGVFPETGAGQTIWSDALQDWAHAGYRRAQPVLAALGDYAAKQDVRVAIEPVDHWETAAPNLVSDLLAFLEGVASRHIGVCIDSAHVALGSDGPAAFAAQVAQAAADRRLHDVHLSPPDRGAFRDCWIDWPRFLAPILAYYDGPMLVEVFNAIPAFLDGLRLTRRKFWIPGEDDPQPDRPSAYDVARDAITTVRDEIARLQGANAPPPSTRPIP